MNITRRQLLILLPAACCRDRLGLAHRRHAGGLAQLHHDGPLVGHADRRHPVHRLR